MEPLPTPNQSPNGARRILAVAALIFIALFILQSRRMLEVLFVPQSAVQFDPKAPLVNGCDGTGYYAWLRSPLIDGDFQFDNEFTSIDENAMPWTATGHRANHWPVGPAIVWAPAVVTVHAILSSIGSRSPWPADGNSAPYQLALGGTTLALALLTLVLMYRIARRFAGPTASAAATALLTLGTPFVAYGAADVSMAHGPATAAMTLFVFVWLRTFGSLQPLRWLGVGCLLGLVCLMRWQLSTFAALPALEAIWLASRAPGWRVRTGIAARLAFAGIMTMVVFIPQCAAMQVVYGHPFGGLHKTAQNWLNPALWAVLFSTDRSLFYWTPIALPAFGGLVYMALRNRQPAVIILLAAAAIQMYAVSALIGNEVFLGSSFGFRMLTETCVLFAVGAASLFETASTRAARWLASGGGLLVGWNLILLNVFRHGGGDHGGGPIAVCAMVAADIRFQPLVTIGMLILAGLLTYALVGSFQYEPVRLAPSLAQQDREKLAA